MILNAIRISPKYIALQTSRPAVGCESHAVTSNVDDDDDGDDDDDEDDDHDDHDVVESH